jgi:hypothetical protein
MLQRKRAEGCEPGTVPPIVQEVLSSPGQPLDAETRAFFEPRFGHDFGNVRVHTDAKAAESARAVNALAYTVGRDVVFGRYNNDVRSSATRSLVAHELAHVVQQSRSSNVPEASIHLFSDRQVERVADDAAVNAASGRSTSHISPVLSRCLQRQVNPAVGKEYSITLIMPPGGRQVERNLNHEVAIRLLRSFLNRLRGRIEAGKEGHNYIKSIREDQYIVGWVSDVTGGVRLPPLSIWDEPARQGDTAKLLIAAGEITSAARVLQSAANAMHSCDRRLYEYREGTISGAEKTKFALEVVEVAAAATVTIGTGGTAGVVLGAGYVGAQRLAGEVTSTRLGLQERIDWEGVLFDTLFAAVCGKFGGRLGNAIARRLGGRVAAKVATALVVGRASALAHAVARNLFDSLLLHRADLTVESFIERLAEQLTLRAVFFDLVSLATGAGTQRLGGGGRPKPPVAPSRTSKSTSVAVTDIATARARLRPSTSQNSGSLAVRPRAVFDGSTVRSLAPQEAPSPVRGPLASPAQANAPDAVVLPFRMPASASGFSATGSPSVYAAPAIAAAAGPTSTANQPLQVRLELPSQKADHSHLYASLVRQRRLEHIPSHPRRTAQRRIWDSNLRPNGPMGMNQRIWDKFEAMDISESRRLRPDWFKNVERMGMEVDHRVEWQLLGIADRSWGDSMANYELLDQQSNSSAGSTLQKNIQKERQRLARVTGNSLWLTQRIVFTQLIVSSSREVAKRWLPEEIENGLHYFALLDIQRSRGPRKK